MHMACKGGSCSPRPSANRATPNRATPGRVTGNQRREFSPQEIQQIQALLNNPNAQQQAQQATQANRASVRATPGLNVTTNRPDVPVQAFGQSPAINQLQQSVASQQQLEPQQQQAQQQQAQQANQQVQSLFADLEPEDIQIIQDVYKNIPPDQYNNPQAVQAAAKLAEQNAPVSKRRSRWRKIGNFFKKALPFIGTIGGAIAAGPVGGMIGGAAGSGVSAMIPNSVTPGGSSGSGGSFMGGKSGAFEQISRFTPEQRNIMDQLSSGGLRDYQRQEDFSPIQNLLSGLIEKNLGNQFNFDPFKQKATRNFEENTLPGIFERFTSLGKGAQSTGAFQGMLARGGAELNEGLAALEQDYALKNRALSQSDQQLLQGLLGQQQQYSIGRRGLGLNALSQGLQSPFETAYRQPQKGFAQSVLPELVGAGADIGKEWIKNKYFTQAPAINA